MTQREAVRRYFRRLESDDVGLDLAPFECQFPNASGWGICGDQLEPDCAAKDLWGHLRRVHGVPGEREYYG